MPSRIVHLINAECDISVERLTDLTVRIRITEKHTENPTDFEIEGSPLFISEALAYTASVLSQLNALLEEDPS